MKKRITCISILNDFDLRKINKLVDKLGIETCKVPYLEEDRAKNDRLPYHFTLYVCMEEDTSLAIDVFRDMKIDDIKLEITGASIKESYNNSWNLYLSIGESDNLKKILQDNYTKMKIEKYNPQKFYPYITIHCDDNYEKIIKLKEQLEENFEKFEINFNKIGLFEIYPVKQIL